MTGKPISESRTVMSRQMMPQDANPAGNVHGGVIMANIDTVAAVVGMRHARRNVVTASVDRLDFLAPVFIGDLIHLKASCNFVGRSSMEIGVHVRSENPITGTCRHTVSAYLTFVALDEDGRPTALPELILENDEDRRRNTAARIRREIRTGKRQCR